MRNLMVQFLEGGRVYSIMAGGSPEELTQHQDRIDRGIRSFALLPRQAIPQGAVSSQRYVNAVLGFSLKRPEGWVEQDGPPGSYSPVSFRLEADRPLPMIAVTVDDISKEPQIASAMQFSEIVLAGEKRTKPNLNVAEIPHAVEIGGLAASRFAYEFPAPGSDGPYRATMVQFIRGRNIFTVNVAGMMSHYKEHKDTIESVIASFAFEPLE